MQCGFTLSHYGEILEQARGLGFEVLRLCDAARLETGRRQMILRHDIDFSLPDALRMAELESSLGLRATYCVLPHAPTYHLGESQTLAALRAIRELGHEIALHYDLEFFEQAGIAPRAGIEREAAWLGELLGTEIRSVSQHRPARQGRFDGVGAGFVDAYDEALTRKILYLSDSRREWRNGCVHEHLPRASHLQLLVHPLWWDAERERGRREIVRRIAERRGRAIRDALEAYADEMGEESKK
jgi:hypothetical protein